VVERTHGFGQPGIELNVYHVPSDAKRKDGSQPGYILWSYRGGLMVGVKQIPETCMFRNLGGFFVIKGLTCVVADYRLITGGAKYPSGGKVVYTAVEWIFNNLSDQVDLKRVLLLSNSAGALNHATYLLNPEFYA